MNRNLSFLSALIFLNFLSPSAQAWEKIISCNNDALVVDMACYSYRGAACYTRDYQIVLNDRNVAQYFKSKGALGYFQHGRGFVLDSHPAILTGGGHMFEVSPDRNYIKTVHGITVRIPYADTSYRVEYVLRREGAGMRFTATKIDENRNDIAPRGELANWYFESCRN